MNYPSLNPHEVHSQVTYYPLFANFDRQKAFDTMIDQLRKQGQPSAHHGWCVYRDDEGNKCAVGALIPDEAYTPKIEDLRLVDIVQKFYGNDAVFTFLRDAQRTIHDRAFHLLTTKNVPFLVTLELAAREFAAKHNLKYTPPIHIDKETAQ